MCLSPLATAGGNCRSRSSFASIANWAILNLLPKGCGRAVSAAGVDAEIDDLLVQLQRDLFALGARLADPAQRIADRVTKATLAAADIARLETWIDTFEEELPPLRRFILPGGSAPGATLHLARTVCRRAERRIVGLGRDAVGPVLITYVNRLSDLLFVLARAVNTRAGVSETAW